MRNKKGDGTIIYDSKNKRYIGQLTTASGRKSFSAKNKIDVQYKMIAYKNQNISDNCYSRYTTFEAYALKWFRTYKINDMKKQTYDKEYRRLKNVLADIGDIKLNDLTTTYLQQYINTLQKSKSPKTIKNIFALINGCLRQCVLDGYIKTNYASSVRLPKSTAPDMVALTNDEVNEFIKINEKSSYINIFKFAMLTGLRISEICGLQKTDVDYNLKLLNVNKQLVRLKGNVFLDTPKTANSVRKVPLCNEALEICKSSNSRTAYLFDNPVNHKQLFQNTLSMNAHRCFKKCYEVTKKEVYQKANFHSFRHTFATRWVVKGGNVNLLAKCLGHSDANFTTRVYVQPDYSDLLNEFQKIYD